MPATNSAIEATKRNRAMMHKPHLYETMKRYQRKNGATLGSFQNMTKEEQIIFEEKMAKAKDKAVQREVRFYLISTIFIGVFLFFVFKNFLLN